MNNEYIWIEGCDIHHTGNSEGINIKAQSYHITIRNNKVHDISPGTADQYNQAGVSLEAADLSFMPGVNPDIWIEGNEIYNVIFGRWANGLQVTTMGPKIKNNYIHDCEEFCILFNDYLNGPGSFETFLYNNRTENCKSGINNGNTSLKVSEKDPGSNPNRPQDWYNSNVAIKHSFLKVKKTGHNFGEGTINIYDLQGRMIRSLKDEFHPIHLNVPAQKEALPNGLYLFKVWRNGEASMYKKLVLEDKIIRVGP
jgi:hypothetical protein